MKKLFDYLDRNDGWTVKSGTFEKCTDQTIIPVGAQFISDIVRDGKTKLPLLLTLERVIPPYHFKARNNGSIAKDTCFVLCA